jgi:hypothetical protein
MKGILKQIHRDHNIANIHIYNLLHARDLGMKLLQDKEKIMGVSPTWLPRDNYGFLTPRCIPHKIR